MSKIVLKSPCGSEGVRTHALVFFLNRHNIWVCNWKYENSRIGTEAIQTENGDLIIVNCNIGCELLRSLVQ